VRTVDPAQGLVELLVAPDFHTTALLLLHALAQELEVRPVEAGALPPAALPGPQNDGGVASTECLYYEQHGPSADSSTML
jgi:hypothetical protein